ncbi:hypothetical protein [Bifidobacterium longum]|nr:hypothetical protein [Bifidobacterium longum]
MGREERGRRDEEELSVRINGKVRGECKKRGGGRKRKEEGRRKS